MISVFDQDETESMATSFVSVCATHIYHQLHNFCCSSLNRSMTSFCSKCRPSDTIGFPPTNTSRIVAREDENTIAGKRSLLVAPAIDGSSRSTVKKSAGLPDASVPPGAPMLR